MQPSSRRLANCACAGSAPPYGYVLAPTRGVKHRLTSRSRRVGHGESAPILQSTFACLRDRAEVEYRYRRTGFAAGVIVERR